MSIDEATPQEWDYASALSKLSIRKTPDPVEKPDHYNNGAIEAIEAIKAIVAIETNEALKTNEC